MSYELIVEILAAIFGVMGVWLMGQQNIWNWLFGGLNVSLYIFIFAINHLYGMAALQVVFLLMSIYGWQQWLKKKDTHTNKPKRINKKLRNKITLLGILLFVIVFQILNFTDSKLKILDALTTVLGLVATYLMANKILESWLIWIVNDIICIGIYIHQNLIPTAVLYGFFIILATNGFLQWKKTLQKSLE